MDVKNFINNFYIVLQNNTYFLLVFIGAYFVTATVDVILGSSIATIKNEKNNKFSSRILQLGILRKLGTMLIMVLAVPVALTLPYEVGFYSLTILYIGIATSELYSVAGHIGIVKDGNKGKAAIGKIITDMMENAMKHKKG